MDIVLGIVIGLIISWILAWVFQPLLFKDKASIDARFARIERYLGQSEGRLQALEATTMSHASLLQNITGSDAVLMAPSKTRRFRFGRIRFRQIMGVVFVLKPFIPLIMLLMFGLFGYLMVLDIRNDEAINNSLNQVTTNIAAVQTEITSLGTVFKNLKADFVWIEDVFEVIGDILDVVKSVVNTIIDAVNSLLDPFSLWPDIRIPRLNLSIPGIRNISQSIEGLVAISEAVDAIIREVEPLYQSLKMIALRWWGYAKILFFLILGWLVLSTIANAYANISRGLGMIRQQPALVMLPAMGNVSPKKPKKHLLKPKQ